MKLGFYCCPIGDILTQLFQDDSPRKFPGWPGKLHLAGKPKIIFESPEFFEMTNVLIFMGIFTNFDNIYASKERKFRQKVGFMMQIITI